MATDKLIPYGSDASAGTFECADCGHRISMSSQSSLPPCPQTGDDQHTQEAWQAVTGQGDAKEDPYPNQQT